MAWMLEVERSYIRCVYKQFKTLLPVRICAQKGGQKGGFSPFLFGLLMGVGVLSVALQQMAARDMIRLESTRVAQKKEETADIRSALESAILMETAATYSTDLTLTRAKEFGSLTTGKTRSGSDFVMQEVDAAVGSGYQHKRVLISGSDDDMLNTDIGNTLSLAGITAYQNTTDDAVSLFDTEKVRNFQIEQSLEQMHTEVGLIYEFYAGGNFRFPTSAEYTAQIGAVSTLRDIWGNSFTYQRGDEYGGPDGDQEGRITFTTPWGETKTIRLDMN